MSSSGKRPASSFSTSGCEENQAKKRRDENESNTISAQPSEQFSLGAETLSITASTSTNVNVSASVSSVSGASTSSSESGDEPVMDSSQQCYAISLRE